MTEHGFYHPSRGYWQTTSDVPQRILDTYPEGTVEVPLKPGADYDWNGSEWVHVLPDPAAQIADFRQAVQAHVDAIAQFRDYDNGNSLASYTSSTVEAWRAEAEAFVAWRDAVWTFVIGRLAQVEAGEVAPPENTDALIAMLPEIDWPGQNHA